MTKALVTAHLKTFSPDRRKSLQAIREQIAAELPDAQEIMKYGIPTFVIDGVPILGFNGYKKHNSLFPYSGSVTPRLEKELAGYFVRTRETSSPIWQEAIFTRDTTMTLQRSKDDFLFGIQAVDADGNVSLPSIPRPVR